MFFIIQLLVVMSSITLTLTGNTSNLRAEYFPPIDLDDGGEYVCGLVDLQTFNSIPNVDETNNMLYYGSDSLDVLESYLQSSTASAIETNEISENFDTNNDTNTTTIDNDGKSRKKGKSKKKEEPPKSDKKRLQPLNFIQIPTGSYDVTDLERIIQKTLALRNVEFTLTPNKNTLQCQILCSQPIDFTKSNSIGPLLGFKTKRTLTPNQVHISHHPADILRVNVVRIECNIIKGAYLNSNAAHTIHEFSPNVPPGYKIIEKPQNVIYFPVTVKSIHDLNLTIVDQDNNLVNFRGERITVRLHIKKV